MGAVIAGYKTVVDPDDIFFGRPFEKQKVAGAAFVKDHLEHHRIAGDHVAELSIITL